MCTDSDEEVEQTNYSMAAQKGPITPGSSVTSEAEGGLDFLPMQITAKRERPESVAVPLPPVKDLIPLFFVMTPGFLLSKKLDSMYRVDTSLLHEGLRATS